MLLFRFHISFLVKSRKVLLSESDDTGLPQLETLPSATRTTGSAGAEDEGQTDQVRRGNGGKKGFFFSCINVPVSQMIITINKAQWKGLVKALDIK